MTREQALAELDRPLYDPQDLEIDIAYFCKKLRITRAQFDRFMSESSRHYTDFPTWERHYQLLKRAQQLVQSLSGRRINIYS
jgi:hypothetical protein